MTPRLPAGPYFLDTSTLVKAYILEKGSEVVDVIFQNSGAALGHVGKALFVSSLGILEAVSVFQRLHSVERTLGASEFQALYRRLLTDIEDNLFSVLNPGPRDFETAFTVVGATFLAAVDALHIGMTLNIDGAVLVSSDDKLNDVARKNRLVVFDPTKA